MPWDWEVVGLKPISDLLCISLQISETLATLKIRGRTGMSNLRIMWQVDPVITNKAERIIKRVVHVLILL